MGWLTKLATGNPMLIVWIAAGAMALGAATGGGLAWTYQGARLDALQARYDSFVAQTKILGEQAQKDAKDKENADKLNKERTDHAHKTAVDKLNADLARLRAQSRTGGGGLSTPPAFANSPDRVSFDRTEFNSALRSLDADLLEIIGEGAKAVVDLDAAKNWANNRPTQ
jgi:hypothetical protein